MRDRFSDKDILYFAGESELLPAALVPGYYLSSFKRPQLAEI